MIRYSPIHFEPVLGAPKHSEFVEALRSLSAAVFEKLTNLRKGKARQVGVAPSQKKKRKSVLPTDEDEAEVIFDVVPAASSRDSRKDFATPVTKRSNTNVPQHDESEEVVEADLDSLPPPPTSSKKRKDFNTPMAKCPNANPPQHNVSERLKNKKKKTRSEEDEEEVVAANNLTSPDSGDPCVIQDEDFEKAAVVYTLINMSKTQMDSSREVDESGDIAVHNGTRNASTMDTVEEEEKYETFSSKKSNVSAESRPDANIEDAEFDENLPKNNRSHAVLSSTYMPLILIYFISVILSFRTCT